MGTAVAARRILPAAPDSGYHGGTGAGARTDGPSALDPRYNHDSELLLQTHDLVLCELARSTYNDLFDNFDRRVKASMQILYVHAPLELCRLRNRRRRHDESRSSVPDRVLTKYYTSSPW